MAAPLLLSMLMHWADLANADNPVVQTIYTADPAPLVHDGRIYLFTGHDEDGSTNFDMRDWRLFSTDDLANWQHHGVPMSVDTFSWASDSAWAGQAIERNGKFYFYVPVKAEDTGNFAIGVGVSDSITEPFVDALGEPLVPNTEIDPSVFIDDDGQAYLYWGNPNLWYVKLNEDMVSLAGEPVQVELTDEGFGTRPDNDNPERPTMYEEGPWLYKRNGVYYLIYAAVCCPENIQYSTGPSATGPWSYGGVIMPAEGGAFTNHPGIVEYEGTSYFFYHNAALPGGGGYTRSVAVESFSYNEDGSIPQFTMTDSGPPQIKDLDPYLEQRAATMAWAEGVETEEGSDGTVHITSISNGDYLKVNGVQFGDGAAEFTASVSSATNGGSIELRLDSVDGALIGTLDVENSGGWDEWASVTTPVSDAVGLHDLFLCFTGPDGESLFNVDSWVFS